MRANLKQVYAPKPKVGFKRSFQLTESFLSCQVSTMLDRLYTSFDALSRQHGVFKVETIGDAYMAVTNLVGLG